MMNNVPNDVDIMWDYILYVITEVADIHCPLKRTKIRKKCPHLMEKEIIEEIYPKKNLYRYCGRLGQVSFSK